MKLTKPDVPPLPSHPAKYSEPILTQLRAIVRAEADRLGRPPMILDSMAGVGRVHLLRPDAHTVGVELEPEWAACHPDTWVGDATDLPAEWANHFDAWVCSPPYATRMADHHDAKDRCKQCRGTGKTGQPGAVRECRHCKGRGLSPRMNYRVSLGRMPTEGSGALLNWGDAYRSLHRLVLAEAIRVTDDGGLIVVNMSNHKRGVKTAAGTRSVTMRVVEWWLETMLARGLYMEAVLPVVTRRMRRGSHSNLRAGCEQIIVCRKPVKLVDDTP